MLIIFAGHAQMFSMDMEDYGSYFSGQTFVLPTLFGVTLFFFISGYIITALVFTLRGVAFIPIFSCAISHPDWWCFRWLNWKLIMAIGLISYTFYLMHAMLLKVALELFEVDMLAIVLGFAATLGISALMWR